MATYIPGFERYGKGDITIRHLMTHMSGLRPDVDLGDMWSRLREGHRARDRGSADRAPGARFVYSDISYFLLGDIVRRVSGQTLDRFAQRSHLQAARHEGHDVPAAGLAGAADRTDGKLHAARVAVRGRGQSMLRGVVHDPTARRMGGVAGHAGLFSTAADLAIFCRMLLDGGGLQRRPDPVAAGGGEDDDAIDAAGERNVRGLGWDMDSSFSSNRGELMPIGSFGHTGLTGTSLWIDPATKMFVVFLSNRVHPDGKGDVTPLRARVATIAASASTDVPADAADGRVWTGRDFGRPGPPPPAPRPDAGGQRTSTCFAPTALPSLKGKRVGLVTNHTGRARDGATTIDLLHGAKDVTLVRALQPGARHPRHPGRQGAVRDRREDRSGDPLALRRHPPARRRAMLEGIDTMVIDLQDIGTRFYTYMTTMAYVMEEAAKRKIAVVVLDRPNPINGFQIEGPAIDKGAVSFIGYFPDADPPRHDARRAGAAVQRREQDRRGPHRRPAEELESRRRGSTTTGLPWINPSPNMRNLIQATLYPGIGAIEGTNISVGRGTDTPFEQVGAPWIDGVELADALNARNLPGIRFYPVRFTPAVQQVSRTRSAAACS